MSKDTQLSDRAEVMKELAEQRKVQLAAEAGEQIDAVDEDGQPIAPVPAGQGVVEDPAKTDEDLSLEDAAAQANAAAEAEEDQDPSSDPAPSPAAAPAFDPNSEYELVVEGQKIKVKGAQILDRGRAAIQKETAADYKLQMASQLLEEAKRRVADLPPGDPAPARTEPAPTSEIADDKLAEMIQFGTKEQAAEAVKLLRQRGKAVDPEQIMDFVSQQMGPRIQAEIEFRNASEMVKRDYADIMGNEYLRRLFYVEENRRRAARAQGGEEDMRPHSELYRSIGDDLRKAFNMKAPAASTPSKEVRTLEQRKEAKQKTPVVPSPASARVEGKAPARPPTNAEIIDKMRAARHQRPLT